MYMDVQSLRIAWLKYIEIIDALVRLGGERLCEITPFRTWLLWIFLPTKIVSTHPHLNPHGCCLTFPLLHIRVCVKNRAPTKTHCLKPHCGIAGLDKPLYTDGEYAHLSLCWLIPLWLLVVEILCWTKPYRDASSFQLLVTFGGMNIHSSFRCSLLLFFSIHGPFPYVPWSKHGIYGLQTSHQMCHSNFECTTISPSYGGFLKWGYPQFSSNFHYEPSSFSGTTIYGNPHLTMNHSNF
jgi:hypothetical protein